MAVKFYHGGVPGLRIGDYVLPASETKTNASLGPYLEAKRHLLKPSVLEYIAENYTDQLVCITQDIECAKLYAYGYRPCMGTVYEVEPIGDVDVDPDGLFRHENLSFRCIKARVVAVVLCNPVEMARCRRIMQQARASGLDLAHYNSFGVDEAIERPPAAVPLQPMNRQQRRALARGQGLAHVSANMESAE